MNRKRLIIIGAGSVGGFIAYNVNEFGNYDILGFLDDDKNKQGKHYYNHPVLGSLDTLEQYTAEEELAVVVGIADPTARKKIVDKIRKRALKVEFPNFIARKSWISPGVSLGKGIIIYPGVSINYECILEDFIIINMNCALGHNCTIGPYSSMAPGVNLGGFTYVGDRSQLCIGVSTRQGIQIGSQSLVGGQSMVVKNVPSKVKVMGVPAYVYSSQLPRLRPMPKAVGLSPLPHPSEVRNFVKSGDIG